MSEEQKALTTDDFDCLLRYIVQKPDVHLTDIFHFFHGLYPLEILKGLKRIYNHTIERCGVLISELESECELSRFTSAYNEIAYFPIPHYLDADWRFSHNTNIDFCRFINSTVRENEEILFVGTPSLYMLYSKHMATHSCKLVEANEIQSKDRERLNVPTNILSCQYSSVENIVCDPPWYFDAILQYIEQFSSHLVHGGTLYMCMPPQNTRPRIHEEYSRIIDFGKKRGMNLVRVIDKFVNYVSPPFEVNSLRESGVNGYSPYWRWGDLWIFKKTDNEFSNTVLSSPRTEQMWKEYCVDKIRFKVKNKSIKGKQSAELKSIAKNDIYPSVSSREYIYSFVDVWTSGNRVYSCEDLTLLHEVLGILQSNSKEDIETALIDPTAKTLAHTVKRIVTTETLEYAQYWK